MRCDGTPNSALYPFGLEQRGIGVKSSIRGLQNKYLFNSGSELQSEEFNDGTGLDWYEAKNRMIDPQLGRFFQIDPMGDFSKNISPYVFGSNNPISLNDPLGLADSLPIVTVTGYITTPFIKFFNWFNGGSSGYTGSGWGYGPRQWMANKIGMGNDANWGVDYLKYDWYSYGDVYKKEGDSSLFVFMKSYYVMQKALLAQGRDIYYKTVRLISICRT